MIQIPHTSWTEVPDFTLLELLDEIEAYLRRYMMFTCDEQIVACALWIVHTHVLDAFDVTPYLGITSPEKGSGKTRLLECLQPLVYRPEMLIAPTEAVLFRLIDLEHPTMLLDEIDAIFGHDRRGPVNEGLRAIINAGYRRGASVPRLERIGDTFGLRRFNVFGPKALAGIGNLPGTIADRSIPIRLLRKADKDIAKFLWPEVLALASALVHALKLWAPVAVPLLAQAKPDIPLKLNDRATECWWTLCAIADFAGGDWPERARAAALVLHGHTRDDDSLGVQLLRALREIFKAKGVRRIATQEIMEALDERESEPWHEELKVNYAHDPLFRVSAGRMAKLLKPYGVKATRFRMGDVLKHGYSIDDFAPAFKSYLEPEEE